MGLARAARCLRRADRIEDLPGLARRLVGMDHAGDDDVRAGRPGVDLDGDDALDDAEQAERAGTDAHDRAGPRTGIAGFAGAVPVIAARPARPYRFGIECSQSARSVRSAAMNASG